MKNMGVSSGLRVQNANSRSDCEEACERNTACTGFDYSSNANPNNKCFLATSTSGAVARRDGVNHYNFDRNCPGTYSIVTLLYCTHYDTAGSCIQVGLRLFSRKTVNTCLKNLGPLR